jgi:hypothetical protein
MTTIRDYINKCKAIASKVLDEQERIVLANENKIVSLNVDSLKQGQGSDDKLLKNSSNVFKGTYTLSTQLINPEKTAGNLYTFQDSNDFIRGLQININPSLTKFNIFSTGTGSGDKASFFNGYTNLFGLNKKNSDIVNYNIVYPELIKFLKRTL